MFYKRLFSFVIFARKNREKNGNKIDSQTLFKKCNESLRFLTNQRVGLIKNIN